MKLRDLIVGKGVKTISARDVRDQLKRVGKRKNKYGAKRAEADGYSFDSTAERDHYLNLKLRQRAGDIHGLELQPRFPMVINDVKVCEYRADFRYRLSGGGIVVEDVKSPATRTAAYRIKKKLMLALYGIEVVEVV